MKNNFHSKVWFITYYVQLVWGWIFPLHKGTAECSDFYKHSTRKEIVKITNVQSYLRVNDKYKPKISSYTFCKPFFFSDFHHRCTHIIFRCGFHFSRLKTLSVHFLIIHTNFAHSIYCIMNSRSTVLMVTTSDSLKFISVLLFSKMKFSKYVYHNFCCWQSIQLLLNKNFFFSAITWNCWHWQSHPLLSTVKLVHLLQPQN